MLLRRVGRHFRNSGLVRGIDRYRGGGRWSVHGLSGRPLVGAT